MRANDDFVFIDCCCGMDWISSIEGTLRCEQDLRLDCQALRVSQCCFPRFVQEKSSLQRVRDGRIFIDRSIEVKDGRFL